MSAFEITRGADDGIVVYSLIFDPHSAVPLAKAIAKTGREVTGHVVQEVLIRLAEIGEPEWANELSFDSESDACVVYCSRKAPLVHLLRRLEKRLAEPARLRRLVASLPEV